MSLEKLSSIKSFGGDQMRFSHASQACSCDMTFASLSARSGARRPGAGALLAFRPDLHR